MTKKNTDHVVMANDGALRCLHCFALQKMPEVSSMEVFSAVIKAFTKAHAKCKAPKELRCPFCFSSEHIADEHVNATCPFSDRWPGCGDTGLSSNAIYTHFIGGCRNGVGEHRGFTAPSDPADFGRCYRLLAAPWASEWRQRISEMARYPRWAKLAPAWDGLEALYVEELQNADGQAPKLYERMKELRVE